MGTVEPEVGAGPDADAASVASSLVFNSSAWQERLDQARQMREKILAERALNGDTRFESMSGPRPWERQAAKLDPEMLAKRRRMIAEQSAASAKPAWPQVAGVEKPVVDTPDNEAGSPVANGVPERRDSAQSPEPVSLMLPVPEALPPPPQGRSMVLASAPVAVAADGPTTARRGGARSVLIGSAFAFGLGIGLGMVAIPMLLRAPQTAVDVAGPVVTGLAQNGSAVQPTTSFAISTPISADAQITDLSAALAGPPAAASTAPAVNMAPAEASPQQVGKDAASVLPHVPASGDAVLQTRVAPAPAGITVPDENAQTFGPAAQAPERPVAVTEVGRGGSIVGPESDAISPSYPFTVDAIAAAPHVADRLLAPSVAGESVPWTESPASASAPVKSPASPLAGYTIRILAPEAADKAEIASLASRMTDGGIAFEMGRPLSLKISRTHVRFYHAADAEAAHAVAASVGAEARDFTSMTGPPSVGSVELWVSGTALAAESAPVRKKRVASKAAVRKAAPAQPDPVQALRNRLAAKLRNGDHL